MITSQAKSARVLLVLMGMLVMFRLAGMARLPLMDTTEARYVEIARTAVNAATTR